MKKKILFIALHFPPSEGVADIRATNIARELSKLNYDVTVLTANKSYYEKKSKTFPEGIEKINIIRVNFFTRFNAGNLKGNKKIPTIVRKIILRILPYIGLDYLSFWQSNAIKEVIKRQEKFDYILATGPPFSNFILAKKIAQKLDVKYILDYRDLWTLSPHGKKVIKSKINVWREMKVVRDASLITFVSDSMQHIMNKSFKIKKSIVLNNGFNENSFNSVEKKDYKNFTISYVGNFYLPKRTIDPLFKVFNELKKENFKIYNAVNFIYCGRAGDYINKKIKEYDIEEIVENRGLVSRDESFSITKSSDLSVVITSINKEGNLSDRSIVTGKVFEALGMNTKILCIAPLNSDIRGIINHKDRGEVFYGGEINKISDFLMNEILNISKFKDNTENNNIEFEWSHLIRNLTISINRL